MKMYPFAIATAAIAITATALVGSGTASSNATARFTVSATQLMINQRISQAAVLRSNEALMDLSPVRPPASTSKKPINPWPTAQRGLGWPTAAYQDGSVTAAKLATPVQNVVNNITRVAPTKLVNAQTVTLWSAGILTLQAACTINSGGTDIVAVNLTSTGAGAAADGIFATTTPGTPPVVVEALQQIPSIGANSATAILKSTVNTTGSASLNALDASGVGPDGTSFTAQLTLGSNLGIGATNGGAGTCTVFGNIIS